MATNRIGFRAFRNASEDKEVSVIVDSNVLIAYFDETHANNEEVSGFLDALDETATVTYYTTVTTKAEFLDYQRKRFLTEGIFSLKSHS